MRSLDFSSWQGLLSTLLGLVLVTFIAVGLRLLVMQRVQSRRERENRQINERLRTLIAAYRTLGGSFTGDLDVSPLHLRNLDLTAADAVSSSDRSRRIRDAVEAALSDIVLLGTEAQVRLAAVAATELAAGRPVHTAELVISLRAFIREVLDLEPIPSEVQIPRQGPARPGAAKSGGDRGGDKGDKGGERGGGGGAGGGMGGGAGGGAGVGMGLGVGAGAGAGAVASAESDDSEEDDRR